MKLTVKALVLGITLAGASAALATSHSRVPMVKSHQAVVSAAPIPTCGPSGCNGNGGTGKTH